VIAMLKASGIRAGERDPYDPHDASRSDLDLCQREITVRGKGGGSRIVRIGHEPAQALDPLHPHPVQARAGMAAAAVAWGE
jgi:site-specific recombinase XerC